MRPEVGFGEGETPSASLPDETSKGEKMRGLLASPPHQTLPRDCYEPTWYRPLGIFPIHHWIAENHAIDISNSF